MNKLQQEIRDHILDCLELDIDPGEIKVNTPLFDPEHGLGLDSLEALEIVTRLSTVYGANFDGVEQDVFTSVETLAAFVEQNTGVLQA